MHRELKNRLHWNFELLRILTEELEVRLSVLESFHQNIETAIRGLFYRTLDKMASLYALIHWIYEAGSSVGLGYQSLR